MSKPKPLKTYGKSASVKTNPSNSYWGIVDDDET